RQFNADVFLRDRASDTTVLVSVNVNGTGGAETHSTFSQVSTNGRYVLFESVASDLVTNIPSGSAELFVRDLANGTTKPVSVGVTGGFLQKVTDGMMTPDGRYVVFVGIAGLLFPGNSNLLGQDVVMRDLLTDTSSIVSVGTTSSTVMAKPVISPD